MRKQFNIKMLVAADAHRAGDKNAPKVAEYGCVLGPEKRPVCCTRGNIKNHRQEKNYQNNSANEQEQVFYYIPNRSDCAHDSRNRYIFFFIHFIAPFFFRRDASVFYNSAFKNRLTLFKKRVCALNAVRCL